MTYVGTIYVNGYYYNLLVESKLGIHFIESHALNKINKLVKLKMIKIFILVQSKRQLEGKYWA